MSGLTFVAKALKLVNSGGFVDGTGKRHATDYVVFKCPSCLQRNKQSMYLAEYSTPEQATAFTCWKCRSTIELTLPVSETKQSMLLTPEEYAKSQAQQRKAMAAAKR